MPTRSLLARFGIGVVLGIASLVALWSVAAIVVTLIYGDDIDTG